MKKNLIFLITIVFMSCQENLELKAPSDDRGDLVEQLIAKGFAEEDIQFDEKTGNFILEGDMVISPEAVSKWHSLDENPDTAASKTNGRLKAYVGSQRYLRNPTDIKVRININTPSTFLLRLKTGLNKAIKTWNDAPGSYIKFRLLEPSESVAHDVYVTFGNLGEDVFGKAQLPYTTLEPQVLTVDADFMTDRDNEGFDEAVEKYQSVFIHELGHIMGYRHSDSSSSSTSMLIPGTDQSTSSAKKSVMYSRSNDFLVSFSQNDIMGISKYYGTEQNIHAGLHYTYEINYLFNKNSSAYVRYDLAKDHATPGSPHAITYGWPGQGMFANIDAACKVGSSNSDVYLFSGSQYIRYDMVLNRIVPGNNYPANIIGSFNGNGMFSSVDAAFSKGDDRIYLFKGNQYITYDMGLDQIASGNYPANINGWGIPFAEVGAAISNGGDLVYFFDKAGLEYVAYSFNQNAVVFGPHFVNYLKWPGVGFGL